MHIFDLATRFYGGNAIVGGGLALALSIALGDKMQGRNTVTACFFGDGAVDEGEFHESVNLASLWRLPVLFVCENNLYAMTRAEAETDLSRKAAGYRMPGVAVDGMDVIAVESAARSAIAQIRSGSGPQLLECRTYRFRAHSMFDAQLYRDKDELERWPKNGPIVRFEREIPHYYLGHTVDLGAALGWLETFNAAQPVPKRLLPAVLLLKASALALRAVPQLNGTYADGAFQPGAGIHVGWAISLRGGGLVAPAIRNADQRSLPELMTAMRDLVQRARNGGLRSSELSSPTVTVTSLGERGAETVMGIIYPPQSAIIGFGSLSTRPWVADGRIEARPLVTVSLAADHRSNDGHVGAVPLNAIEQLFQEPDKL